MNVPVLSGKEGFTPEPLYKGEYWHDKKHYSASQDLVLISPFPYLAQQPAVASGDGCGQPLHLGTEVVGGWSH